MDMRNTGRVIAVAIAFAAICSGAYAQSTVYKWVDEDGVVHFSDSPPAEEKADGVETVAIPKAPPAPPVIQSTTSPQATTRTNTDTASSPATTETPVAPVKIDITSMSLRDLDRRCETARERRIAPLRAAEIEKCKADKRNDPAWCERFNADYGDAGRTASGVMRPRMFDDLPECVEALQERNRRGR